jgi:NodT family efflux transporter outer membrane factor (OMF) lipoprotein
MSIRQSAVRWSAAGTALVVLLGACAVGPDYVRPEPPDVAHYGRQGVPETTRAADGHAQRFLPGAAIRSDWWRLFRSASLDAMVQRALTANPTLQASLARLHESENIVRAGYGLFYPHIEADGSALRERASGAPLGAASPGSVFNVLTISGTISYAIDIFGGQRRQVEGLQAQADDQANLVAAATVTLTANVVDTCIARAAYADERRFTLRLIELQTQVLQATEAQVQAGTASGAILFSIRSLIAANQALLAPLDQQLSHSEHLLAILQGDLPARAVLMDIELGALVLPEALPVSLPSDFVRQRPDILSAEAQLHAASAAIGVATAQMFPSFSLSATYGVTGPTLGSVTSGMGTFWSIGPAVTIPLFQGGTLWYGRKAAVDAYGQAQALYRQTVLAAFAQVADCLAAVAHDADALQAQVTVRQAANDGLAVARANFQAGLIAYLEVMNADIAFQTASIAYVQALAQRHQDTVALYAALGGGWWNQDPSSEAIGSP